MAHYLRTTRNRETGRPVTVGHGEDLALDFTDDGPWYTICDDHGYLISHTSMRLARAHGSDPLGWCEDCMVEAGLDD